MTNLAPEEPWLDDPWDDPRLSEPDDFVTYRLGRRWWRWLVTAIVLALVAGLLVAGGLALWVVRQVDPPGEPGDPVAVSVPAGTSLDDLAEQLQRQGVITSASAFRWYVERRGGFSPRAGSYSIPERAAMGDVLDILKTPPAETYTKVTFPEGFNLDQIAKRLEAKVPRLKADTFLAAARSRFIQSQFAPPDPTNLEGLLFPDTYNVSGTETEGQVLSRMVNLMDRVGLKEDIDLAPSRVGLTPYQVLIVASMIEKEAKVPEDRPKIARVIYNRLFLGSTLDIDATLIYASGGTATAITQAMKDSDSPYNTYKVKGLPPTPIANPGRASIHAAMNPATGPWLFYVLADNDGRHAFATTLAEHERNVAAARAAGVIP